MNGTRAIVHEKSLKIVAALRGGPRRFSEIYRVVGAKNHPELSARLKKLVRDGLIVRHVHKLGPPAIVSYELTALGADFAKRACPLIDWAKDNADAIQASRDYHTALAARS